MFHGQPYCGTCDYEGPDFMWTWHFDRGLGVLVQNRESLELRVVQVPDDEVFYRGARQADKKADQAVTAYVDAVVAGQLPPGERPALRAGAGQPAEPRGLEGLAGRRGDHVRRWCRRVRGGLGGTRRAESLKHGGDASGAPRPARRAPRAPA